MKQWLFALTLLCLMALPLAAQATMFDNAETLANWGLNTGKEFPGASGDLRLGKSGKVTIEGKFTQNSAYVAAMYRKAQTLPNDTKRIEIVVNALTPCDAAIRICDADKRYFQTKRIGLKPGAQTVLVAQLDSAAGWDSKWGGKDLEQVTPKFPLREIYLNAIRPYKGSQLELQIDGIRIDGPKTAANVQAVAAADRSLPALLFDNAQNLSVWGFDLGREFAGAEGQLTIGQNGQVTAAGDFSKGGAFVAPLFRKKLPENTKRIEFSVTALSPCDTAIRICDADRRFFQTKRVILKPGVPTTLTAYLDSATDWDGKWGGKDLKDVVPKQPFKEIYVNAIRPQSGNVQQVKLQINDVRIVGPEVMLDAALAIDNEFHLLLPGDAQTPVLKLHNLGQKDLMLEGKISLTSYDGAIRDWPINQSIVAGASFDWSVPLPAGQQGTWLINWELTDQISQKMFTGTDRVGRMVPAGETQERFDTYLFGVCSHPYNHAPADREKEARIAALCGVKIMRTDARWERQIQPRNKDEWNFSIVDHIVDTYAKHGMEVQLILTYGPRWAVSKDWKPFSQEPRFAQWGGRPEYEYWKAFVEKTFERYRGKIRYYETWNEPDLDYFANFSVEEYLEMQKIAYKALRSIDPEAKLLSGGVSSIGTDRSGPRQGIIGKILAAGTCDVFAFHAHGGFQNYQHQLQYVREELKKSPMPWYSNETAITSSASGEYLQAKTLFQKFLYAWTEGSIGYNWYDLRNDGFNPRNNEHNYGMVTFDFRPKPVYLTYNMLASHFRGAKYESPLAVGDQLSAYQFRALNGDLLVPFWRNNPAGPDVPVLLGGITGKAELIDLMGNRKEWDVINGEILFSIGFEPVVLRLTEQATALQSSDEPLLAIQEFPVDPGTNSELAFPLRNPSAHALEFGLNSNLPAGVSGNLSGNWQLAPGETRTVRFQIAADATFRSYAAQPEMLTLTLTIGNHQPLTLAGPILTAINIPAGNVPKEPAFLLNRPEQLHSFVSHEPRTAHLHWKGVDDLSAEIRLAQKNNTLLLEALVTDDVHHQKERGVDVWKGDNIQFAIKFPTQNDFWEIGLTRLDNRAPEVFIWRAPTGFTPEKAAAKIRLTTTRDETKKLTVYRAEIPFDAIGLNEQIGREGFRFNLIVNDNDGEMRESFLMVAPGIGADKDTTKYPLVRFR